MSGAVVAMGENSPRYSTGASGFMSHMSMWEAPPQRKKRIVDLAGFFRWGVGVLAKAAFPRGSPKQAAVEAVRKERRLRAEENSGRGGWGVTASGWFGGNVLRCRRDYASGGGRRSIKFKEARWRRRPRFHGVGRERPFRTGPGLSEKRLDCSRRCGGTVC